MSLDVGALEVYGDNQIMVRQVNSNFEATEEHMVRYLKQVYNLKREFEPLKLVQIKRRENLEPDVLSKLASGSQKVGE